MEYELGLVRLKTGRLADPPADARLGHYQPDDTSRQGRQDPGKARFGERDEGDPTIHFRNGQSGRGEGVKKAGRKRSDDGPRIDRSMYHQPAQHGQENQHCGDRIDRDQEGDGDPDDGRDADGGENGAEHARGDTDGLVAEFPLADTKPCGLQMELLSMYFAERINIIKRGNGDR
jgi:hypothetical protein